MTTSSRGSRATDFARRSLLLAFGSGFLVATITSTGLVGERLVAGDLVAALIVDAGVLGAGIVALTLLSRALNVRFEAPGDRTRALLRLRYSVLLGAQVAGATSGIVVVHVLLKWSGLVALQWMSECPRQLVNDAVATFGTLAAVWACAPKQLRLDVLVATLAALLVYGMTRSAWHVDRPPVTFVASIQELVVGLVIAVATGLLAFRRFSPQ